MIKLSGKIISSIVGVVVAGTVVATAAVNSQPRHNINNKMDSVNSVISSTVSSSISSIDITSSKIVNSSSITTPSSERKITTVIGKETNSKITSDVLSKVDNKTTQSVSQLQEDKNKDDIKAAKAARLQKEKESSQWPVIDPDTGGMVYPGYVNYDKIKAELGGDAGIVPTNKSTACQKAKEEARQKYYERQKAESGCKPTSSQDTTSK